jgi:hypothetical protein
MRNLKQQAEARSNRLSLVIIGGGTLVIVMVAYGALYYTQSCARQGVSAVAGTGEDVSVVIQASRTVQIAGAGANGLQYDLGGGQVVEGDAMLAAMLKEPVASAEASATPLCIRLVVGTGVAVSDQQLQAAAAACRAAGARAELPDKKGTF